MLVGTEDERNHGKDPDEHVPPTKISMIFFASPRHETGLPKKQVSFFFGFVFLLRANPHFPGLLRGLCVPGTHLYTLKSRKTSRQRCEEYLLWAQQSRKACEQSPSGLRGGVRLFSGGFFWEFQMEIPQSKSHGKSLGFLDFNMSCSFNYIVRVAGLFGVKAEAWMWRMRTWEMMYFQRFCRRLDRLDRVFMSDDCDCWILRLRGSWVMHEYIPKKGLHRDARGICRLDRLATLHIYKVSHSLDMFMCSTYQTSFDFIFIQMKGCCRNTWYVKLHPFKTRFKQFGSHWSALLRFNARQRHSWFLTKALVKSQVAERGSKNPIRNSGEKTSKPWIYPVKPQKIHVQSIQKCCQREAPNPHGDQVVVLDWKMACDDFWLLVVMKWEECKQLLALERHKVCRFSSHWLSFSFHPFLRNLMRFENFLSSWNLIPLEHFVLISPFLIFF